MKQLTKKQQKLYDVIKKYIEENTYSPTMVELAKMTGVTLEPIHIMLVRMRERGYIDFQDGKPRTIKVVK